MKKNIILLIRSFLILIAIRYIGSINSKGLIDLLLLTIIVFGLNNYIFITDKREKNIITIFSVLLSLLIIFSKEIYLYHGLQNILIFWYKYILIIIGLFELFKIVLIIFINILNKTSISYQKVEINKKTFIISVVIMIIVYLICYASFYPGIFSFDMPYQDKMAKGIEILTTHHPLIHTMLWKVFLKIESISGIKYISIIGYSLLQLSFVIFTYIYMIRWEIKNI